MRFLLLMIVSIFSGIFAGMGMGGGTFLIPILSIFFSIPQIFCQSTNIISFVLIAVICSVIYIKKKLVNFNIVLFVALPASIFSFFSVIFALKINSNILKILFSCFMILIGTVSFVKFFALKFSRK